MCLMDSTKFFMNRLVWEELWQLVRQCAALTPFALAAKQVKCQSLKSQDDLSLPLPAGSTAPDAPAAGATTPVAGRHVCKAQQAVAGAAHADVAHAGNGFWAGVTVSCCFEWRSIVLVAALRWPQHLTALVALHAICSPHRPHVLLLMAPERTAMPM